MRSNEFQPRGMIIDRRGHHEFGVPREIERAIECLGSGAPLNDG